MVENKEYPLKVTVAIPCYNAAPYIGLVIQSVLEQTYPPDEVLVVDDGSTDHSLEIIQRYPVRIIQHSENRGISDARNSALSEANGNIIVFIDADAVADPDLLAVLLSGYDDQSVGGVGGQGIESNILSLADRWRYKHSSQTHGTKPRDVEFLYGLCMSFRVNVLRLVGGFHPAFRTNAEDMDVCFRVRKAGFRLRYLPSAKVYHQRTDDEIKLKNTMARWYSAAYQARLRNNAHPWRLFAGTLCRLVSEPFHDLLIDHDREMARLSFQIGLIKIISLWQTAKKSWTENRHKAI